MTAVDEVRRALVRGEPLTGALTGVDRVAAGELLHLDTEVRAEVRGAGPLQRLLDDPVVTDVLVNGTDGVWIDRGDGLEQAELGVALDEVGVRRLATRLAAACGRRLDDANP